MSRSLLLFGAGNIGRSFIGQIFARNGWEVVFADVSPVIVSELNRRGSYKVVIKHPDGRDEELRVTGVRAIDARDSTAVGAAIEGADLAATAVGAGALPAVARNIAEGLRHRLGGKDGPPLDLILAENVRDAAELVRASVAESTDGDRLLRWLGLVQTSIGKMVPIMPREVAERDPLLVYAEPYNTLIVDRLGFRGERPSLPEIHAVENIRAYVDRKLFLHNLGHAAVAYLGFRHDPELRTIAEAVQRDAIYTGTRDAMSQAAAALGAAYPESFRVAELEEHRDDLLRRFGNPSLGDTLFRVGRDLPRKLGRDDRLVGAMLLAAAHGLRFDAIARVYDAATRFAATDEQGNPFVTDPIVTELTRTTGVEAVLRSVSSLDPEGVPDREVMETVLAESPDQK